MSIHIAKVHDVLKGERTFGTTILVDRLWPRGVKKADLNPDLWLKGVAPSTELRTWFHHEPEKFEEFTTRYAAELDGCSSPDLQTLIDATSHPLTLLYGAADREHNHAIVLAQWLNERCLP
ncbi:hypothetical protein CDES_04035 [Corynebacterium deserti GIMN1.010]|uniref:Uroporphyrin-III C-methyltransferase n=1 Tax=Corynebacterium deserti GIMN1.010 TaxID=931089 RepID=A0A0M4CHE7_9CORY|nr:DUF488 domain-containing protein [Corynebacterium deserti]ALC05258.1 hypothetical protein CDES_04035 [Corynebacterium deserti GIMN1.010]